MARMRVCEFLALVNKMRTAQIRHERSSRTTDMFRALELERKVDAAIEESMKATPDDDASAPVQGKTSRHVRAADFLTDALGRPWHWNSYLEAYRPGWDPDDMSWAVHAIDRAWNEGFSDDESNSMRPM